CCKIDTGRLISAVGLQSVWAQVDPPGCEARPGRSPPSQDGRCGLTRETERRARMNDRVLLDTQPSFIRSPVLALREACEQIGRDEYGLRCPECPLRRLCQDDSRWLISCRRGPLHGLN